MGRFTSFVILGAMRTGSNFLEASLAEAEGLTCYGEAFNPAFLGHRGTGALLGLSQAERDADPARLLARMTAAGGGLPGFRLFQGHDARVLEMVLADPACAKVILTRHPLDSHVSLAIARATDQWLLRQDRHRRAARIRFDPGAFAAYATELRAFYDRLRGRLRETGQVGYEIGYDELTDPMALNRLIAWLEVDTRLDRPSRALKRQNPGPAADKVENPEDIAPALAAAGLAPPRPATPPRRRGPAVQTYVAAPATPLLFLPVPGGPVTRVEAWMAALDGAGPGALMRGFDRAGLARWRADHPGAVGFTVVSHPLARAHAVFSARILPPGVAGYGALRRQLIRDHGLDLPAAGPDPDFGPDRHRAAFLAFLRFLRASLAGRTDARTDPAWAEQVAVIEGFARLAAPDRVLRAESLERDLPDLAAMLGLAGTAAPGPADTGLAAIWNDLLEQEARAAWPRDYAAFGYRDWRPPDPG